LTYFFRKKFLYYFFGKKLFFVPDLPLNRQKRGMWGIILPTAKNSLKTQISPSSIFCTFFAFLCKTAYFTQLPKNQRFAKKFNFFSELIA
jgi:hypothetical protein